MNIIHQPITGEETVTDNFNAYAVLVHFYRAFNHADIDGMSDNWANNDDIAMDNPLGGIRRGWEQIRAVYHKIFNGPARIYVEFYDYSIHETSEMFYTVGRERGYFCTYDTRIDLAIRTSRIFLRTVGGWKQIHHHGSIEDPELLRKYQTTVMQIPT